MNSPAQPNQSLIDGIACLQALAVSPDPIGTRELGRMLDLEPTRVNRLLKTLSYLGIAQQSADRKYASGPGMHVLATQSLFGSGLVQKALPSMERLGQHGYITAFGVLWKDSVSYLYFAKPGMPTSEALGKMGLCPASISSIGLSLLAANSDEHVEQLYQDKTIPGFPEGVAALLDTLAEVREKGFARVKTNAPQKTLSIGLAVGEPAFGAVALSGKIVPKSTQKIVSALRDAAQEIDAAEPQRVDPAAYLKTISVNV